MAKRNRRRSFTGLATPPTKAEMVALALAAKAGDRAAADRLALACWPFVARKGHEYARRFGAAADEVIAVGMGRFPHAVRGYQPRHGGFLNYFASAACREMVRVLTDDARRQRALRWVGIRTGDAARDMWLEPAAPEADPDPARAAAAAWAAFEGLPADQKEAVRLMAGIGCHAISVSEHAAKKLGVTERAYDRLALAGVNAIRAAVATARGEEVGRVAVSVEIEPDRPAVQPLPPSVIARNIRREWLQRRRERVRELRAKGMSLRCIGEELGIDRDQVRRDLKAPVRNRTPAPAPNGHL